METAYEIKRHTKIYLEKRRLTSQKCVPHYLTYRHALVSEFYERVCLHLGIVVHALINVLCVCMYCLGGASYCTVVTAFDHALLYKLSEVACSRPWDSS